ncbi:MAG: class I SAM-dependent methyltransferase [Deltaproteobacteria bacterium]|nr:class I SAM-dependent methyltransferase [Deltaproteobacteria bacterium]
MSVAKDLHACSVREIASATREAVVVSPCPVCGVREARPRFGVEGCSAPVVVCSQCGLGRYEPMPGANEVLSYYPEEYYGQQGTKFQRVIESLVRVAAARHIAFLSRGLPARARVLDVGCGRGVILGPLAERDFEVHGVELRVEAALGVDPRAEVRVAPRLADAGYAGDHFHEVVLWHVLEHLADPRGALAEAFRVLRPGGRLVVAVPNFSSLQARWAGAAWFHLDAPRHLFHFPREALLRLLEELGFAVESEHHFSLRQNPFGWIQSGLNRSRRLPRNGLYTLLHERSSRAPAPYSRGMRCWLLICGLLAAPFALAASVIAAKLRRGATLHVVARKPG